MPVQTGFFDHQVMTRSFKITAPGFNQHDDINDHPGEYMETVKAGDRKKVIGKIGGRLGPVNIQKRISAPPGTFMIQMRPFPGLATQEKQVRPGW